jgi:hypothetical protein
LQLAIAFGCIRVEIDTGPGCMAGNVNCMTYLPNIIPTFFVPKRA